MSDCILTLREALEAMEAGKDVESRTLTDGPWVKSSLDDLHHSQWSYRLKPKPQPKLWQIIKHWEEGGRIQEEGCEGCWYTCCQFNGTGGGPNPYLGDNDYQYRIHPEEEVNDA